MIGGGNFRKSFWQIIARAGMIWIHARLAEVDMQFVLIAYDGTDESALAGRMAGRGVSWSRSFLKKTSIKYYSGEEA